MLAEHTRLVEFDPRDRVACAAVDERITDSCRGVVAVCAVADAMLPPELQVSDHTSIDRALDVLRGSRTDLVLVRDDTGRCAGIVTREQLSAPGAKPWYADNTRVRDIVHDHSPFACPAMPAAEVAADMRERSLAGLPVVDDDGYAVGIVTAARLRTVLTTRPGNTTEQPDRDLGAGAP